MDNEKRIMDAFIKAGKPLSAKEASELSGLEKKEVDKLIKKLKDEGKLESPKRCYYQPK
jgi:chromosome segregation and condensation protein ScpB